MSPLLIFAFLFMTYEVSCLPTEKNKNAEDYYKNLQLELAFKIKDLEKDRTWKQLERLRNYLLPGQSRREVNALIHQDCKVFYKYLQNQLLAKLILLEFVPLWKDLKRIENILLSDQVHNKTEVTTDVENYYRTLQLEHANKTQELQQLETWKNIKRLESFIVPGQSSQLRDQMDELITKDCQTVFKTFLNQLDAGLLELKNVPQWQDIKRIEKILLSGQVQNMLFENQGINKEGEYILFEH